jgi:hypothetical protein
VIHLHGIDRRDHSSLAHMPPEQIDPLVRLLLHNHYAGVVTLEIFGTDDLLSSQQAWDETLKRITRE